MCVVYTKSGECVKFASLAVVVVRGVPEYRCLSSRCEQTRKVTDVSIHETNNVLPSLMLPVTTLVPCTHTKFVSSSRADDFSPQTSPPKVLASVLALLSASVTPVCGGCVGCAPHLLQSPGPRTLGCQN